MRAELLIDNPDRPFERQSVKIREVVIYDDAGNPIFVACQTGPAEIKLARIKDHEFQRLLKGLGIDRPVEVTEYTPPGGVSSIPLLG